MDIVIEDPMELLSKTQRKKIRKMVVAVWKEELEDQFHDELDKILDNIYYEGDKKYNVCKFDYTCHNQRMVLKFEYVHIQTKEERREELKKKLHAKLKSKHVGNTDPGWKLYENIRSRIPEEHKKMIPTPDQVKSNIEMYRTMMTMIPNQNPLYEYLSFFIPPTAA